MKRNDRKSGSGKKALILMVSLVAILAVSVGGVLAWLATSSGEVKNTFAPGKTNIEIEEKFENNVKSDVKVINKGNIPVYIRANLVFTWKDSAGNIIDKPADAVLNVSYGNGDWAKGSDGFWYYTKPVAADGGKTTNLIDRATIKFPEGKGYKMDLEVMAQSIQAEPKDAVEGAWGVTVKSDGSLTVVR